MLRPTILSALVLAPLLLGVNASPSQAFHHQLRSAGFEMPSRNITCVDSLPGSGRPGVACVVSSESGSRGSATWTVTPRGRARAFFVIGNIGEGYRVLAYGRSWRRYGITCTSRSIGLTCRNQVGHGFFLSRERQRIF